MEHYNEIINMFNNLMVMITCYHEERELAIALLREEFVKKIHHDFIMILSDAESSYGTLEEVDE